MNKRLWPLNISDSSIFAVEKIIARRGNLGAVWNQESGCLGDELGRLAPARDLENALLVSLDDVTVFHPDNRINCHLKSPRAPHCAINPPLVRYVPPKNNPDALLVYLPLTRTNSE